MNALMTSSRSGVISLMQKCTLPTNSIIHPILDNEEDVLSDGEVSLDDLSVVSKNIKEPVAAGGDGKTVVGAEANTNEVKTCSSLANTEPTTIEPTSIWHVKEFLEPYIGTQPLQPTSVLQQRYNALQHQLHKQGQTQSVKPWYRYEQRGDSKDLWWVCEISVPSAVAQHWGFDVTEASPLNVSSGYLSLSLNEWEMLVQAHNGKDLLLDLFGVYKKHSVTLSNGQVKETLWFKTKSGAQKNCTLNFLFLMDDHKSLKVQGEPIKGASDSLKPKQFPGWVDKLYDMGFGSQESGQRLKLRSIKYHAALKDPSGCILSSDNPCLIRCVVTYFDCESDIELTVTSEGYFSQGEAFEDVMSRLETSVSGSKGRLLERQSNQISEKEFIVSSHDKNIFYEVALPPWSSCKIGSHAFLYELKFHLVADTDDEKKRAGDSSKSVPLTHAYGLEMAESTRIGLLSGCDIFEAYNDGTQELAAEFTMPDKTKTTRAVTVTMCNRSRINLSDLNAEITQSGKFELNLDPVLLMNCFNSILFENRGNTYGISPPRTPKEILLQLQQMDNTEHDRTYFLLPLLNGHDHDALIDWKTVLEVVHNVATPALQPVNIADLRLFWLAFLLLAAMAIELAICILTSTSLSEQDLESSYICHEHVVASITLARGMIYVLMVVIFGARDVNIKSVPPRKVSTSVLLNRFVKQPLELKNRVFVLDRKERNTIMTALSLLVPEDVISEMPELASAFLKKFGVQLGGLTYASFYQQVQLTKRPWGRTSCLKRYFIDAIRWYEKCSGAKALKFPKEPLMKAVQVVCHKDHDYTILGDSYCAENYCSDQRSITNYIAARGHLVPELTSLLPMPRDLLYLGQHACRFMTALERAHSLQLVSRRLFSLSAASNIQPGNPSFTALACLLDKATEISGEKTETASCREEERLETLGDAVLMFLIVINLFASSSNQNEYVLDMFDDEITVLGRNKVLSEAALLLGLHRLTYDKTRSVSSWKSAYTISEASSSAADTDTSNMKRLSNTLESILGASYLSDSGLPVGILNEMTPCFRPLREGKNQDASHFYSANSTCFDAGYDFKKDLQWTNELNRVMKVVQKDMLVLSKLESGASKLFDLLLKHSEGHDSVQKIKSQNDLSLLVHAALFDDSLEEDGLDKHNGSQLKELAVLRDKIFHVGNATLQLSLVEEIYQQYPNATSGDLHFAKAAVLSDDCLAYIHLKRGFAECMYDEKNESALEFKGYVISADALGVEFWTKNEGWAVPGGNSEYQRRMQLINKGHVGVEEPCYVGLAAGRLFGMKKKIPKDITGDLVFSMKAIVGALCILFGKDVAWSLIRPVFLELLLLSPEEMRVTYADVSDLAVKCQKGKR